MPVDKSGKHFHNPAIMREHERNAQMGGPNPGQAFRKAAAGAGHDEDHGEVQKSEHFHPDHPENPSPGNHHVVLHHADGHEAHSDHGSAEEAQTHIDEHQKPSLDEQQAGEGGENGQTPDVCPECGGTMVEGKCEVCGYEDDGQMGDGGGQDGGGNGGY